MENGDCIHHSPFSLFNSLQCSGKGESEVDVVEGRTLAVAENVAQRVVGVHFEATVADARGDTITQRIQIIVVFVDDLAALLAFLLGACSQKQSGESTQGKMEAMSAIFGFGLEAQHQRNLSIPHIELVFLEFHRIREGGDIGLIGQQAHVVTELIALIFKGQRGQNAHFAFGHVEVGRQKVQRNL